jgi:hypothetical protein
VSYLVSRDNDILDLAKRIHPRWRTSSASGS